MHDSEGNPLAVGDRITIEYEIASVHPDTDYCNVTAYSVLGRKPDENKECFTGNTAVTKKVTTPSDQDHKEASAKALYGANRTYDSLSDAERPHADTLQAAKAAAPGVSFGALIAVLKAVCASGAPQDLCAIINAA
jgi:hypothetical protein